MKKAIYFSNSPTGARKANGAYKKEQKTNTHVTDTKKAPQKEGSLKQSGIYNQWLLLCTGLCLSFLLLITSGDRIQSFSRSDGVVMISEYLKDKIDEDETMAVFFGFKGDEQNTEDDENVQSPAYSESDIPVFVYGEGLQAHEYIEKYNSLNYTKSGTVPVMGVISSEYSFRKNPFWGVYKDEPEYEFHSGLDIAADEGEDILCYLDGVVEKAALSASYGYYVCIDHGEGFKTLYAHASELLCETGDKVSKGDVIAKVGSTGRATGPHLHFEVIKDGYTVNPKEYLGGLYEQS